MLGEDANNQEMWKNALRKGDDEETLISEQSAQHSSPNSPHNTPQKNSPLNTPL